MSSTAPPVVSSTQFNLERMEELCDKNFMTATELANWLVKEHDVPFRETHHVVGSLVGAMVKQGKDLTYLDDVVKHLNDTCGLNTSKEEIKPVLTPKDVMLSYNSLGGTGPEATKETVQELREEIQNHADVLSTDMNRVSSAMEATRAICRDVSTDGSCTTGQLQSLIEKYSPA